MKWLNYHHLFYFWTVAREGTIARAASQLRLSEPTVGAQIHELERSVGRKLFKREGRGLSLTEAGRVALEYANDIFTLGQEFQATIGAVGAVERLRLSVGISDVVPRLFALGVLQPALRSSPSLTIISHSDSPERLVQRLVTHEIDLVISDAPLHTSGKVSIQNRLLSDSGVTIFAAPAQAARCRRGFPESLDGEPFLLPRENTASRRALEHWFASVGIRPDIRGEFSDGALLKTFGRAGVGAFASPTSLQGEIVREYRVRAVGRVESVRERYYISSAKRRVPHPAVAAITEAARSTTMPPSDPRGTVARRLR